jgi:hypothetical protein
VNSQTNFRQNEGAHSEKVFHSHYQVSPPLPNFLQLHLNLVFFCLTLFNHLLPMPICTPTIILGLLAGSIVGWSTIFGARDILISKPQLLQARYAFSQHLNRATNDLFVCGWAFKKKIQVRPEWGGIKLVLSSPNSRVTFRRSVHTLSSTTV